MSRERNAGSRTAILCVVAAAHVALLWLVQSRRPSVLPEAEEFLSVWLPAMPATAAHPSAAPPSSRGHSRPGAAPSVPFSLPGPLLWPAPSPPAAQQQSPPPGAGVDWMGEAGAAADATIERMQQDARRLHALTSKYEPQPDPLVYYDPRAGFWSGEGSAAHTIEFSHGIPILHVGRNCVVVFFVMPFCVIGHIEARGNLLDPMDRDEVLDARSAYGGPDAPP
ncbi:MAG TPA: hypothetical protein VMB48_07880 [Steroidobacteraceae bacterium]|nr:hypothetical protein [Steroidobacteraceae bacterium]